MPTVTNHNMKTTTYIFLLTLLLFSGCSGTDYNCQSDKPKILIGNFRSYQTFKEFEKYLFDKADTIIVFENSRLSESDTRPEFSIYTVIIPNYKLENVNGKLRASFYNDRLMSIWFYPDNISKFNEILESKYDISIKGNEDIMRGCLRINHWTDFEGNEYYGWSDLMLINEQNDWISKYS